MNIFYIWLLWKKTITIKTIIAIKNEFKIPARIANESPNSTEISQDDKNISENEIIFHNNGKKLMLKNSTGNKYIFKSNTSTNNQSENELIEIQKMKVLHFQIILVKFHMKKFFCIKIGQYK